MDHVIENDDVISLSHHFNKTNQSLLYPLSFLNRNSSLSSSSSSSSNVLLILNQKITIPPKLFINILNNADLIICADGGINQLKNFTDLHNLSSSIKPHYVIGDLDSATPENLSYYTNKGTIKLLQSSQYYTDFNKSVSLINTYFNFPQIDLKSLNTLDELEICEEKLNNLSKNPLKKIDIFVLGGVGGRFDQTISIIHQIYKYKLSRNHINFTILNPEHEELIFLLPPGENFINMPKLNQSDELKLLGFNSIKSRHNMRNVGILPLLNDTIITTHGLKWDVTNWSTSLKSKVSSSNLQVGQEGFIIKNSDYIFVNVEL